MQQLGSACGMRGCVVVVVVVVLVVGWQPADARNGSEWRSLDPDVELLHPPPLPEGQLDAHHHSHHHHRHSSATHARLQQPPLTEPTTTTTTPLTTTLPAAPSSSPQPSHPVLSPSPPAELGSSSDSDFVGSADGAVVDSSDSSMEGPENTLCAYYLGAIEQRGLAKGSGAPTVSGKGRKNPIQTLLENKTVVNCNQPAYCYSIWTYEASGDNTSSQIIMGQGCWQNSNVKQCSNTACMASSLWTKTMMYFCCCEGSFCNLNFSVGPEITTVATPTFGEEQNTHLYESKLASVLTIVGGLVFVVLVSLLVCMARCWAKTKPLPDAPIPENIHGSSCIDMEAVKLLEIIGRGRYGVVYRAMVNNEQVAVKLFQQHHYQSYVNEKYIYTLPHMDHPNLLSYFGGGEYIGSEGQIQYGLVLSYCPQGRLSDYLSNNTLDWASFCTVALTTTRGLAHLHSDICKGDKVKPCISHRDLNTRNILLRPDMTCVLCDMGFAIHIQGCKYYISGEENHAETTSLTDVGTLRYMAPEVLEGAVNLRDCQSALKQIDVYALGLVLWECAVRCHDLYQGLQAPAYMLPFQVEIGLHPSFEQMQVLVPRNKARPLFPAVWKDSNPAVKLLKETIEDCWDQDAEARLSAMCVEGRLMELPQLWDRWKASLGVNGVSPTINPTSNAVLAQRLGVQQQQFLDVGGTDSIEGLEVRGNRVISNALSLRDKETSVSETTVETNVTMSPTETLQEVFLGKNQMAAALQMPPQQLQPHQGRNPCMERNLIIQPNEDLSVSGNTLVDRGRPPPPSIPPLNLNDTLETANFLGNEQLVPLMNGHSSNTQAVLHQSSTSASSSAPPAPRLVPPIPYLQNEVHTMDMQPKRQNVAGGGNNKNLLDAGREERGGRGRSGWRRTWEERFKWLLNRRRQQPVDDEERQILTPTSSSHSEPPTPISNTQAVTQSNLNHSNPPLQTQVLLTNGGSSTVVSPILSVANPMNGHITETEIGIAKLQLQNGHVPVMKSRQGSKDSGLNRSCEYSSCTHTEGSCDKLKRPTTLSLKDNNSHAKSLNEHHSCSSLKDSNNHYPAKVANNTLAHTSCNTLPKTNSDDTKGSVDRLSKTNSENRLSKTSSVSRLPDKTGSSDHKLSKTSSDDKVFPNTSDACDSPIPLRKPSRRVKTPRKPVGCNRFSLYDDRIMGSSTTSDGKDTNNIKSEDPQEFGSNSLSHSLPLHMDTLEKEPFLFSATPPPSVAEGASLNSCHSGSSSSSISNTSSSTSCSNSNLHSRSIWNSNKRSVTSGNKWTTVPPVLHQHGGTIQEIHQ
ncbi:uncharacterized protein LOC143039461 isoform X2 [Oratosquilla oratoria]|uniref:uncharacterized protein LOC143039461 isoform X2 n=1 Tax=Oratosquilla oratoria TaxID=337810 RepID=UPI003F769400